MTCMPNAYPNAIKAIDTIYKVFSQMYIDSKIEGTLNEFICDFLQDENGRFHFLKIASFSTDGIPVCNNDWKLSNKYLDRLKAKQDTIINKQQCNAGFLCPDSGDSKLAKLFEQSCKARDFWIESTS